MSVAQGFTFFFMYNANALVTQAITNPIPIPLRYRLPVRYDAKMNTALRTSSNNMSVVSNRPNTFFLHSFIVFTF